MNSPWNAGLWCCSSVMTAAKRHLQFVTSDYGTFLCLLHKTSNKKFSFVSISKSITAVRSKSFSDKKFQSVKAVIFLISWYWRTKFYQISSLLSQSIIGHWLLAPGETKCLDIMLLSLVPGSSQSRVLNQNIRPNFANIKFAGKLI